MILVDTSVWIEHLRDENDRLKSCYLKGRSLLDHEDVIRFLEEWHLYGRGIGWVDAHLLASMLLTGCFLWTFDKPLRRVVVALNVLCDLSE